MQGARYESTQEANEFIEGMEENKEGLKHARHWRTNNRRAFIESS
jgi:hypothetical protein